MFRFFVIVPALLIAACTQTAPQSAADLSTADQSRLTEILAAQPDAVRSRYEYRHPQETLAFIGIKPGMSVVEVLPGNLWYTGILLPYLGESGTLTGADYPVALLANFPWMGEQRLAQKRIWVETWTAERNAARQDGDAAVAAFQLGSLPESMHGSADAVIFFRALHNLARFGEAGYLQAALRNALDVLKPGGIVGVVQHRAPESATEDFAQGKNGYLKQSFVIAQLLAAGFEFVAASEINANPKDQPAAGDNVWRLPPSLRVQPDSDALREQMKAIGESDRMTLKFRKPVS